MIEQIFEFAQNHWMLSLSAAVILALLIFEELKGKAAGLTKLSAQDVSIMLNRESAVVMDLREQKSFLNGHILGSINANKDNLDNELKKISSHKELPLILVSDNDANISNTAAKLRKLNFTKIYMLSGGINAWKEAQLPLNKN